MSIGSEFKEFISRGNVVDLAVGVVIGGAFGKIVTSFVDDLVMPVVGMLTGKIDFKELKYVMHAAGPDPKLDPEVALRYGVFLNTIIQFMIIALAIFLMVKAINSMRRQEAVAEAAPSAPPPPTTSEVLLKEIRDSLAARPAAKPAPAVAAPAPKVAAAPKPAAAKAAAAKKTPAVKKPAAKKPAAKK